MARPKLRGVLLCEDTEHERFFLHLLKKWFGRGKIRVERIPNRRGAGDAFVLANYAREVRIARSIRNRNESYALVVAIDGDRLKLQGRMHQLDQKLVDAGLPKRERTELIVICVPTWSIETWELWLCGDHEIDEEQELKTRFHKAQQHGEASAKSAAKAWFRALSSEEEVVEQHRLPSLTAGRVEVERLDRDSG